MARLTAASRNTVSGLSLSKAIRFNGTSTVITVPDHASYSQATTGALTISCWINPETLSMTTQESTGYVVFLSKQGLNTNEWGFRMYNTGNSEGRANRISFYTFTNSGGLGDGVAFTEPITAGQWIHVTATIDSSKVMQIFKNGIKKDQFTSTQTLTDEASIVRIGAGASNSDTISSYWQGMIDDVRIFNRVLGDSEIMDLYRSNRQITRGLVGRWKLDENTGTTATDLSPTANNGTITSGAYVDSLTRGRLPVQSETKWHNATLITANIPNKRLVVRDFGTKSLRLDGSTSSATHASYILPATFSIALWFKVAKFTNNDRLFDQQDSGPANGATLIVVSSTGSNVVSFTLRNSTTNVASLSTGQLIAGVWYHLVATYSVNNVDLYLNGQIQATDISATMTEPTGVFTLGKRTGAASNFFNGTVHDFMVFPRKLTEVEAQELYFTGTIPTNADIKVSFDNTGVDTSGNKRDLTLTSTSYVSDVPLKTRTYI
jgi:hypothetical protein